MSFIENSFLKNKWYSSNKRAIRYISILNDVDDANEYTKKFLNFRTFPYVNTLYGKLLENSFDELQKDDKIEIVSRLKSYLNEIEIKRQEEFNKLTSEQLVEYFDFSLKEINCSKDDLYKQISGGYFGEILLFNILIELGYEKIISKLYLEWGALSPTGIDVPCINMNSKEFVFAESKLFKNIDSALKKVHEDLDNIINKNKLDNEITEWYKRIKMLPENVKEYLLENGIESKKDIYEKSNKIYIIGFVVGNKIDEFKLQNKLNTLDDFEFPDNVDVLIIGVPIDSKDVFIKNCFEVLEKMLKEIENGG